MANAPMSAGIKPTAPMAPPKPAPTVTPGVAPTGTAKPAPAPAPQATQAAKPTDGRAVVAPPPQTAAAPQPAPQPAPQQGGMMPGIMSAMKQFVPWGSVMAGGPLAVGGLADVMDNGGKNIAGLFSSEPAPDTAKVAQAFGRKIARINLKR